MAKKSKIAANNKRMELVERHRAQRDLLRAASKNIHLPLEERQAAARALARLPRDSAPVRLRKRDQVDGRPRGYIGKVGLSRINFRTAALRGELPGITKSSW
ncbi:small subunit ribosomal protein S14 [Micrococcales bacterium KH10]|nr:small subunit ribosomal protein S14 [Micrococcales bacterium KH10]